LIYPPKRQPNKKRQNAYLPREPPLIIIINIIITTIKHIQRVKLARLIYCYNNFIKQAIQPSHNNFFSSLTHAL